MTKLVLEVPDMHCEGCARTPKEALGVFDGVAEVEADLSLSKEARAGAPWLAARWNRREQRVWETEHPGVVVSSLSPFSHEVR